MANFSKPSTAIATLLFCVLAAPFVAILVYFLFHNAAATIGVFVFFGFLYFVMRYVANSKMLEK